MKTNGKAITNFCIGYTNVSNILICYQQLIGNGKLSKDTKTITNLFIRFGSMPKTCKFNGIGNIQEFAISKSNGYSILIYLNTQSMYDRQIFFFV